MHIKQLHGIIKQYSNSQCPTSNTGQWKMLNKEIDRTASMGLICFQGTFSISSNL